MKFMMFTKSLQPLGLRQAGRVIRDLGLAGADLTVRPGGLVDPAAVRRALPEAVAQLRDEALAVPLITTAITSTDDPAAAATFESAAACGIPEIKLGYVRYGDFGTFQATMDQTARDLDGIEVLARRTGVRANLHTHSNNFITALAPVVWWLIKDRAPAAIGAYVDPGHMMVEGGGDGWRMGLDLLSERIAVVAVKDLGWERTEENGRPVWKSLVVPLGEGMTPWRTVFDCLRQARFAGWVSIHSEYQGGRSWRQLDIEQLIDQTRRDLAYLRSAASVAAAS